MASFCSTCRCLCLYCCSDDPSISGNVADAMTPAKYRYRQSLKSRAARCRSAARYQRSAKGKVAHLRAVLTYQWRQYIKGLCILCPKKRRHDRLFCKLHLEKHRLRSTKRNRLQWKPWHLGGRGRPPLRKGGILRYHPEP